MRLFVLIGGLLVLVLLAALIGPYFVDWGNYRDRFETEASRILGQEVRVEGSASARFLPFPSVTFSDVRVGPRGAVNITIEEFSMDAELAPFLRGEILIFDMRLVSPVLRLDLDEQGRPIWEWPSQAPVDPAQIILENAQFVDGTLLLRDRRDNRQWDFVGLSGSAAANNLFGPWRIEVGGLVRGSEFEAFITTGNLSREGFSARVAAQLPESNLIITTDGRVAPPNDEISRWYSGAFNVKPTDGKAGDYRLEGVFEADAQSLVVEEFRGDFGTLEDPYTINGAAEIVGGEEPRFALWAKGNQFNVLESDQEGEPVPFTERLASLQGVLSNLPFPPIPGTVNLDLPALIAGTTTIRDLKLVASPEANTGGWQIWQVEAKLPGRTLVEGKGLLILADRQDPHSESSFVGEVLLASRQPSGLASWLTDDVDEVIRLLPNAGFSADVALGSDSQSFSNLEVILGDASFSGRVDRFSDSEALPYISIALAGNNPDLETIDALSSVMLGRDGAFRILNHDVDVTLDLIEADIAGVTLGQINTDLRIRGERIEVDKLSIEDLFGASISATGTMERVIEDGVAIFNANWDAGLVAVDGAQFVQGMGSSFPSQPGISDLLLTAERDPFAFADIELNSVGSARMPNINTAEASASISGQIGGSDVSLTSTLAGSLDEPSSIVTSLAGTLEHEEATTLLSQAGFEVFPLRLLGAGKSLINMSGSLAEGLSARLSLETPDTKMSMDGVFRSVEGATRFTGMGDLESGDIEPWWDLFGYIFPSTGLGTEASANARVRIEDNNYDFSELTGSVGGNSFGGDISVNWREDVPKIGGNLGVADLDLAFLISVLTGRYDLSDSTGLFAAPLYADHTIDLELQAQAFGTADALMRDAKLRLIYRDGSLSLNGVEASTNEGRLTGSAELQNVEGSIILNGQMALENASVEKIIPALGPVIDTNADLTLAVTGNGKSIEAFIGSLTGSGVIKTQEFDLPGINALAVGSLLKNADAIGYEITDAQIDEIAQSETTRGSMVIAPVEQPISVASGVVRADNIAVAQDKTTLNGNLAYNLAGQTLSGEGRLTYNAGVEGVAGLSPEVGIVIEQADKQSAFTVSRDYTLLAGFVRQRALEREQARVEALQARLLEKQRLRREVRYLRYERSRALRDAEEARLRVIAAARREALLKAQAIEAARIAREAATARENQIQRLLQVGPPEGRPDSEQETEEPDAVTDIPQIEEIDPPAGSIFENFEQQLSTDSL